MSPKTPPPTPTPHDGGPSGKPVKPTGDYTIQSRMIHGQFRDERWDYSHHVVPPMSSSSTYRLESSARGAAGFCGYADPAEHTYTRQPIYIYDRLDEPTRAMLEDRLAMAEGGEMAVCFASGMAAISAALGILLLPGDHLIAHHTLYGCTYSLLTNWLTRWGIDVSYVDLTDPDNLVAALRPKTRAVYLESPVNPTLQLIDLAATSAVIDAANAKRERAIVSVVDNTFATPFCQRPLEFGADIVVHSLTKNLCGFGTDMGGAVITRVEFESDLLMWRKDFGGALGSKHAWPILVYGLPSLDIRVSRQIERAGALARWLEEHPRVERVWYPGLESFPQHELARRQMLDPQGNFAPSNMIYFTVEPHDGIDTAQAGERAINYLAEHAYTYTLAVSLGQIRTLVEKPDTMTHSTLPPEVQAHGGMIGGGIRLSVGCEALEDLQADMDAALRLS